MNNLIKRKRIYGFTLIELLVVISIIALLIAILMPALNKAREQGKRAVCLTNMKSLGVCWMMYADDNDDRIVSGMTTPMREVGTSGGVRKFAFDKAHPLYDSFFRGASWVGWWSDKSDLEAQIQTIEVGMLYPYNQTVTLYRCPAGKLDEVRTYSIGDSMNAYDGLGGVVLTKLSSVTFPSTRMVFIDEGCASIHSWTIHPYEEYWHNPVPIRHNIGTNLSFADGHSEYWKWVDERTIELAIVNERSSATYYPTLSEQPGNPDLIRMQRAVWGRVHRP